MVAWSLFHNTLSRSSTCLVGNAHLVSKVFFPRLILPLSTVYATLVDFLVALTMMGVLMAIYGIAPGPGLLLLPLCAAMILALSLGVGLLAAGLMVSYRDVQYILPVALQFLLYATPIGYPVSAVPEAWRPLYLLNPLSVLVEAFRSSLIGTGEVAWGPFLAASLFACALLTAGAFAFRRMERRFADII
jgi:lipopolysaccharide transport system permease protein